MCIRDSNLRGISACQANLPGIPQVGVFDTAFHQKMPKKAYLYGIPYALYSQYKIRRYGFHGTSHRYVADRAAKMLGKRARKAEQCWSSRVSRHSPILWVFCSMPVPKPSIAGCL